MTNIEIFDAHMLGDASLINTNINKNKHYSLSMCSKHKEYLNWLSTQIDLLESRPIWDRKQFDKRTSKTYYSYWMRSLSYDFLTEQRQRWYPNGTKIVPLDINISNRTLLHWFMDDGSLATTGGIYLATDCFTKIDLNILINNLENNLNLKSSLHSNGKGFRIYFSKKEKKSFFNIIGTCPVSCFSYKWN